MMTQSLKMQSKRIALCILFLGMILPAQAMQASDAAEFETANDGNWTKIKNNPWITATVISAIIAICLTIAGATGDGTSAFYQIVGAGLFGAFALGGLLHFVAVYYGVLSTQNPDSTLEKERAEYYMNNGKELGGLKRAFQSKMGWFAIWCIIILVISSYFIGQVGAPEMELAGKNVRLDKLIVLMSVSLGCSAVGLFATGCFVYKKFFTVDSKWNETQSGNAPSTHDEQPVPQRVVDDRTETIVTAHIEETEMLPVVDAAEQIRVGDSHNVNIDTVNSESTEYRGFWRHENGKLVKDPYHTHTTKYIYYTDSADIPKEEFQEDDSSYIGEIKLRRLMESELRRSA